MVEVEEQRFAEAMYCPHCGCTGNLQKFGLFNGKQRYRCKDCSRTFICINESISTRTRKELSVWEQYIECMLDDLSIRKSAEVCKIFLRTSFTWRHKILDALVQKAEHEHYFNQGLILNVELYLDTRNIYSSQQNKFSLKKTIFHILVCCVFYRALRSLLRWFCNL